MPVHDAGITHKSYGFSVDDDRFFSQTATISRRVLWKSLASSAFAVTLALVAIYARLRLDSPDAAQEVVCLLEDGGCVARHAGPSVVDAVIPWEPVPDEPADEALDAARTEIRFVVRALGARRPGHEVDTEVTELRFAAVDEALARLQRAA